MLQLWDAVEDAEERASADVVRIGLRAAAMASRAGENAGLPHWPNPPHPGSTPSPTRSAPRPSHTSALCTCSATTGQNKRSTLPWRPFAFAAEAGDKPTAPSAWASATAARALSSLNRETEAREYAERALAEAVEIGSAGAEADALVTLATMDTGEGVDGTPPELLVRARDLAQEAGDLPTEMVSRTTWPRNGTTPATSKERYGCWTRRSSAVSPPACRGVPMVSSCSHFRSSPDS